MSDATPNYDVPCLSCGCVPTIPEVDLCACCCFGEHDAWEDFGGHPPVPKKDFDKAQAEADAHLAELRRTNGES